MQGDIRRSGAIEENLERLEMREREAAAKQSRAVRACNWVTCRAGEPQFMILHAVWFAGWIALNVGVVPGLKPFDPFPFAFLTFVVSLESIFLSLAILLSQKLETVQADNRAKLDLQINLLAERETTKILEVLLEISKSQNLPIANDPELLRLLEPVDPENILNKLEMSGEQRGRA